MTRLPTILRDAIPAPALSQIAKYVRPRWRRPSPAAKRHGGGAAKGNTHGQMRQPELEMRLEIFLSVCEPGRCYTQAEIAQACGVSRGLIWSIEKRAMKKLKLALNKLLAREDETFFF